MLLMIKDYIATRFETHTNWVSGILWFVLAIHSFREKFAIFVSIGICKNSKWYVFSFNWSQKVNILWMKAISFMKIIRKPSPAVLTFEAFDSSSRYWNSWRMLFRAMHILVDNFIWTRFAIDADWISCISWLVFAINLFTKKCRAFIRACIFRDFKWFLFNFDWSWQREFDLRKQIQLESRSKMPRLWF